MAYPFSNNQYAQSSSNGHHGYRDPYLQNANTTQFGSSATRYQHEQPEYAEQQDYEPSMVARDAQRDTSTVVAEEYETYGDAHRGDATRNEKALDEGNSPYRMSPDMIAASPYTGKSIWTIDDKRVMAKRSVPARCFRTLFCLILNTIVVIVSIVSLVVIFARPPNVGIGNIVPPDADSVGVSGSALTLNGSVEFVVSNPNSISATLTNLKANIYDKVDTSQAVGTGSVKDQTIEPHTNTTINFPFQIRYDPTKDTSKTILKDLGTKCGLAGGSAQELDLILKVDSRITILSVPIPVRFNQDISFTCPLTADTLKSLGADQLGGIFRKRWMQFNTDRQEL